MKVAILTQPLGKNYGGIIQNYALQRVLEQLGHEAITVHRVHAEPSMLKKMYRATKNTILKLTGQRKAPVNLDKNFDVIFENTNAFLSKNINITNTFDSESKLKAHFDKEGYQAVVVGSDQTWRPMYSPSILNYFLNFLEGCKLKKVAYSTSFGVDYWEYSDFETKECLRLAKLFDHVSVRESSGVQLCEKYLGIQSKCVLDPTLLLNKEEYISLLAGHYNEKGKSGVFTYWLDDLENKSIKSIGLANILGSATYSCYAKSSMTDMDSCDVYDYQLPPLEKWLASIANAELVLTDSFHGMVFSIIFERPFFVVVNKGRGSARFESLLSKLNLSDRLLASADELESSANKIDSINYTAVKVLLNEIKNESKTFLVEALK